MVALTVVFLYVFKNNKICCIYILEVFCLTHTGKSPLVCSLLFVSISIHCFSPFKLITRYTRSTKMRNKNLYFAAPCGSYPRVVEKFDFRTFCIPKNSDVKRGEQVREDIRK